MSASASAAKAKTATARASAAPAAAAAGGAASSSSAAPAAAATSSRAAHTPRRSERVVQPLAASGGKVSSGGSRGSSAGAAAAASSSGAASASFIPSSPDRGSSEQSTSSLDGSSPVISLVGCTSLLTKVQNLVLVSKLPYLTTQLRTLEGRQERLKKMTIEVALQAPRGQGKTTLCNKLGLSFVKLRDCQWEDLWGHAPLPVKGSLLTGTLFPATLEYKADGEAFDVILRGRDGVTVPIWSRARVAFELQLAAAHAVMPPTRHMPTFVKNILVHQYAAEHVDRLLKEEIGAAAYDAAVATAAASHSSSVSASGGNTPIGRVVLKGDWGFGPSFRLTDTIGWESLQPDQLVLDADAVISLSARGLQADELRTLFTHGAFSGVLQDSKKIPVLMHVARLSDVESAEDKQKLRTMTSEAIRSLFRDLSVLPGLQSWEARNGLFTGLEQNLVTVAPAGRPEEEQEEKLTQAMRALQNNYLRTHYINFVKEAASLVFWCKRRGDPATASFKAARWSNQKEKFVKMVQHDLGLLRNELRKGLAEFLDTCDAQTLQTFLANLQANSLTPEDEWLFVLFRRRLLGSLNNTHTTLSYASLQRMISRMVLNSQWQRPGSGQDGTKDGSSATAASAAVASGAAAMELDEPGAVDDEVIGADAPSRKRLKTGASHADSAAIIELKAEVQQFLELELQKPECVQPAQEIKSRFEAAMNSPEGKARLRQLLLDAGAAADRQGNRSPNDDDEQEGEEDAAGSSAAAAAAMFDSSSLASTVMVGLDVHPLLEPLMAMVEAHYLNIWFAEYSTYATSALERLFKVVTKGVIELHDAKAAPQPLLDDKNYTATCNDLKKTLNVMLSNEKRVVSEQHGSQTGGSSLDHVRIGGLSKPDRIYGSIAAQLAKKELLGAVKVNALRYDFDATANVPWPAEIVVQAEAAGPGGAAPSASAAAAASSAAASSSASSSSSASPRGSGVCKITCSFMAGAPAAAAGARSAGQLRFSVPFAVNKSITEYRAIVSNGSFGMAPSHNTKARKLFPVLTPLFLVDEADAKARMRGRIELSSGNTERHLSFFSVTEGRQERLATSALADASPTDRECCILLVLPRSFENTPPLHLDTLRLLVVKYKFEFAWRHTMNVAGTREMQPVTLHTYHCEIPFAMISLQYSMLELFHYTQQQMAAIITEDLHALIGVALAMDRVRNALPKEEYLEYSKLVQRLRATPHQPASAATKEHHVASKPLTEYELRRLTTILRRFNESDDHDCKGAFTVLLQKTEPYFLLGSFGFFPTRFQVASYLPLFPDLHQVFEQSTREHSLVLDHLPAIAGKLLALESACKAALHLQRPANAEAPPTKAQQDDFIRKVLEGEQRITRKSKSMPSPVAPVILCASFGVDLEIFSVQPKKTKTSKSDATTAAAAGAKAAKAKVTKQGAKRK